MFYCIHSETSYNQFFAVPVSSSCILKLSGTGPVCGPSKKDNRTETRLDFKALSSMGAHISMAKGTYLGFKT